MAEVPSVVYRIPEYAAMGIDGVSIGSNDLTQLMLGVDRDSEICAELFDEADAAVLDAIGRSSRAATSGHHLVAVRPGAVEPPRVRRAPGALRHHLDLGQPRRGRRGAPDRWRTPSSSCCWRLPAADGPPPRRGVTDEGRPTARLREAVLLEDVPRPRPGPGQVRVVLPSRAPASATATCT